jgi:hypothetical protein
MFNYVPIRPKREDSIAFVRNRKTRLTYIRSNGIIEPPRQVPTPFELRRVSKHKKTLGDVLEYFDYDQLLKENTFDLIHPKGGGPGTCPAHDLSQFDFGSSDENLDNVLDDNLNSYLRNHFGNEIQRSFEVNSEVIFNNNSKNVNKNKNKIKSKSKNRKLKTPKKRKRKSKNKPRKRRKKELNLQNNSKFFIVGDSSTIPDNMTKISMRKTKKVMKNKKLLNIFWNIVKFALPSYTKQGMINEIGKSDRIFLLEGFASNLLEKENCNHVYESVKGDKVICLCFGCIKYCNGFNQLILICSDLKAKEVFNCKGFGSILLNGIKNYIKKRINRYSLLTYDARIFAFIDPGAQSFYEKNKFMLCDHNIVRNLTKDGLEISYLWKDGINVGICPLYKLLQ